MSDAYADLGPGWRHTDPDTSRKAATMRKVKRGDDRHKCLVVLNRHPGGLTDFELGERVGLQQTSAGKRRGELRDLGFVTDTTVRRPAPSGAKAAVWAITALGRETLGQLSPRESSVGPQSQVGI